MQLAGASPRASPEGDAGKPDVPPSRKNRKSITTCLDEVVLKELCDIAHKIPEGLNYVLIKYRKRG